jgi:D-alanyl-D-alanine carboxypeptidase
MIDRHLRRWTRRTLLQVAALSLGGTVLACDSQRDQPPAGGGDSGTPPGGAPGTPRAGDQGTAPVITAPTLPPRIAGAAPQCLVTKTAGLPPGYVPNDLTPLPGRLLASDGVLLRPAAADAVVRLIDAAGREKYTLFVLSGFRSYQEQERVLRTEIERFGKEVAEKQVAPPGHSEHQLGLAADITSGRDPYGLRSEFGDEPEGRWLAANAASFGFVISYPQGKQAVTGYIYEPWHIRYVGTPLAEEVAASGLTLTEFLPKYNLAGGCP